jgi:hypothetical protein
MVILVYLHGRLWRGGGMGLVAAILVGFNQNLLLRMQVASPSTLAVAGVLASLLCYGWHERSTFESARPWPWAGPAFWAVAGGFALGLSLLSLGLFGLVAIPIVLLHQLYQHAGRGELDAVTYSVQEQAQAWRQAQTAGKRNFWRVGRLWLNRPGVLGGLLAGGVAAAVAVPWHVAMLRAHGWEMLAALLFPYPADGSGMGEVNQGLLARLIDLAPATLPLGLYGAARSVRMALVDESEEPEAVGGALWVVWLAVAALLPSLWPHGPRGAFDLFLLVPLSLLAAQAVADLVNRRVPVRVLVVLAPATAVSVAWWVSSNLRDAFDDVFHGRADAATALGLHLALDLVVASFWFTRSINAWARRRDDRQRQVLAVFLLSVLAITVIAGTLEIRFRHAETRELLSLRTAILRRDREHPFELVALVGPEPVLNRPRAATTVSTGDSQSRGSQIEPGNDGVAAGLSGPGAFLLPGGRLRFILKSALPHVPQRELTRVDELLALPDLEGTQQRLVILTGTDQRLSYAVQSRLGLEAIHPGRSGILDAYATASTRSTRH